MADALRGGLVINEILADPNGAQNFDTDGNGSAGATDEFIELFNASGSTIDLTGIELWDAGVGQWFTFPAGPPAPLLQPGARALVMSGVQSGGSLPTGGPDDLFFDAGRGSALINNGGDNIVVYDPTNDEFIIATFNNRATDDPTLGLSGYNGFSTTATQIGAGEDFGSDTDGLSLQRTGDGSDIITSDAPTPGTSSICFANGTLLATPHGEVPVECLAPGDLVLTADHGPRPITWLFSKTWTPAEIAAGPNRAPVLIRKNALGRGRPARDLRVSQQHRILVQGAIAQRMFGAQEVLIPAKALLSLDAVTLEMPDTDISYFHVMLDQHEVVLANGLQTESLFLGAQTLAFIPAPALAEICALLAIGREDLGRTTGPVVPARPFASGRRACRLVQRHRLNARALALPPPWAA